jgi:hypothetical protein
VKKTGVELSKATFLATTGAFLMEECGNVQEKVLSVGVILGVQVPPPTRTSAFDNPVPVNVNTCPAAPEDGLMLFTTGAAANTGPVRHNHKRTPGTALGAHIRGASLWEKVQNWVGSSLK